MTAKVINLGRDLAHECGWLTCDFCRHIHFACIPLGTFDRAPLECVQCGHRGLTEMRQNRPADVVRVSRDTPRPGSWSATITACARTAAVYNLDGSVFRTITSDPEIR